MLAWVESKHLFQHFFQSFPLGDPVLANHELSVGHVLLIRTAYHLGANQIHGGRPEEAQVAELQPHDGDDMIEPDLAQKNFALGKPEEKGSVSSTRDFSSAEKQLALPVLERPADFTALASGIGGGALCFSMLFSLIATPVVFRLLGGSRTG